MGKPKKLRRLIKAAQMGKPYAMFNLGICLKEGKMVVPDEEYAFELISCAAGCGYAPAEEYMKANYADKK